MARLTSTNRVGLSSLSLALLLGACVNEISAGPRDAGGDEDADGRDAGSDDGSDGGTDGGTEPVVTVEDYVAALCAYEDRCTQQLGRVHSTSAACHEAMRAVLSCGLHQEKPMFEVNQAFVVDEARLPGCIAALAGAPCEEQLPSDCDRVVRTAWREPQGLADIGESCQGGFCIVDALCDVPEDSTQCAVCREPVSSRLGEPCSDAQRCDEGFICNSASGTCALAAPVGTICSDDAQCRSGHCAAGACAAFIHPARGEPCAGDGRCRANLVCLEGVCADRLDVGEACAFDAQCVADAVCRNGQCESLDVCARAAPLGGPCISGGCADGATCDSRTHTCVALPDVGAPCTSPVNCPPNLRCDLQLMQCGPGKADGDSCSVGFECANNACVQGICGAPAQCTMP